MTSSSPDPRGASGPSWSASERKAAAPGSSFDPELLERVLQETFSAVISDDPLAKTDRDVLTEVALRYPGQPLCLQPVATELVFALLRTHLGRFESFVQAGNTLAARIAETLMEDPEARKRLGSLWDRLGGKP